jgi:hypothetical protein
MLPEDRRFARGGGASIRNYDFCVVAVVIYFIFDMCDSWSINLTPGPRVKQVLLVARRRCRRRRILVVGGDGESNSAQRSRLETKIAQMEDDGTRVMHYGPLSRFLFATCLSEMLHTFIGVRGETTVTI